MGEIAYGTAGWPNDTQDPGDYADASNDGSNLVKVTLEGQRDPSVTLDATQSSGQQLLCKLADGVRFPTFGQQVLVAIPSGHAKRAGAAAVIASFATGAAATGNLGEGSTLIFADPVTGTKIAHRADGALVFGVSSTGKVGGAMTTLVLGGQPQTGLPQSFLKFQSPGGTFAFDTSGVRIRDGHGNSLLMGGASIPGLPATFGSYITCHSALFLADAPQVMLGVSVPGVFLPAVWGPSPAGTPLPIVLSGVTSTQVKIGI